MKKIPPVSRYTITPMKKTLFITIASIILCVGGVYAAPPTNAPATVKPQWTCHFTNPITFSDGATTAWTQSGSPYLVDTAGNAAVAVINASSKKDILFISSKGSLLGVIQVVNTMILAVTASSVYLVPSAYSPFELEKYSLIKGQLVKTSLPDGDFTSTIYSVPEYPVSTSGFIGITETDNAGNTKALSFYKF